MEAGVEGYFLVPDTAWYPTASSVVMPPVGAAEASMIIIMGGRAAEAETVAVSVAEVW
jgi:hypothetical protein